MYNKALQLLFITLLLAIPGSIVSAGNIVPGNEDARFYDTDSRINFGLAQGDVTVTDSAVTGYAWAEDWGWINLQPPLGGVKNDGNGNLSGYAWGETLGWINFDPTLGGVSIDNDGFFSGYAWAENGGWIVFSCETDASCAHLSHRVQTTWPDKKETGGGNPPGQMVPIGGPTEEPEEEIPPVAPPVPPTDEKPTEKPDESKEEPVEDPDNNNDSDEGKEPIVGGETNGPGDEPGDTSAGGESEPPISSISKAIGGIIKYVIESPAAPFTSTLLATVGGLTGASSLGFTFLTPLTVTELFLWPSRLWTLLLAALGFRKKRNPWGTVYDSVTKQPLDPAYVQLIDKETNKEVEGAFTDLDGRFGFLPKVGNYIMKARKTNYAFPSKRLFGNTADALYDNLYFGDSFSINSENDAVLRNIPLDPIGVDWNEVQKRKGGMFNFYSKYDVAFYTFTSILFYLGFAVALFATFFFPSLTHTVILIFYGLIVIIRSVTASPRRLGGVYDSGEPLAYAAVRVYIANTESQIKQVVTNRFGKFYCLVTPATYYVKVLKRVGEENFEEIYTSENFYAKDGLVDLRFDI